MKKNNSATVQKKTEMTLNNKDAKKTALKEMPLFTAIKNENCADLCLFTLPTKEEMKSANPNVLYIHYSIDVEDLNDAYNKGKEHEWSKVYDKHYGRCEDPIFDVVSDKLVAEMKKQFGLPKNMKNDDVALLFVIYLYVTRTFDRITDYFDSSLHCGNMPRQKALDHLAKYGIYVPEVKRKLPSFKKTDSKGKDKKYIFLKEAA